MLSSQLLCFHAQVGQWSATAGDTGDVGLIPGSGRVPRGGNGNPLYILAGKSHGQRSLEGYSPWGHKDLDMTEHTHMQNIYLFVVFLGSLLSPTRLLAL